MQMYLLVGVMVLPKTVKITQNMYKALLVAIALEGFLFAQGFEIKSFQVSASSNILNSESLTLKGAVGTTFNQKSSSDSLTLTGGFSKGLQGVYSEPPLISIETDTSNDVISKEDPVVYTAIATDVNGVLNSTLMIQLGGSEIPIEIPMTVINDSVFAAEVPESLLTVRNFRAWVVSEDSLLNEAISPYQKPEMQFAKSELSIWSQKLAELGLELSLEQYSFFQSFKKYNIQSIDEIVKSGKFNFLDNFNVTFSKGWERSKKLQESFGDSLDKDKAIGYTSKGPHRMDITFQVNNKKAASNLSRGQLKILILLIFLINIKLIKKITQRETLLMIDDLGSELDVKNLRSLIEQIILSENQIVLTGIEGEEMHQSIKKLTNFTQINL